jgi:hypothetical protein
MTEDPGPGFLHFFQAVFCMRNKLLYIRKQLRIRTLQIKKGLQKVLKLVLEKFYYLMAEHHDQRLFVKVVQLVVKKAVFQIQALLNPDPDIGFAESGS